MSFTRIIENCRQCGICGEDCAPIRQGLMSSTGFSTNPESSECEKCGHCFSLCPHSAIRAVDNLLPPGLLRSETKDEGIPASTLFHLLAERRSERRFKDVPVPDESISALLSAAAQIPSGGNARNIHCTLLKKTPVREQLLHEIRRFYHRLYRIAAHSFTRNIVGFMLGRAAGAFLNQPEYRRRFVAMVESLDNGIDPVFYHAPVVMLFHTEALIPTPEEDAVLAAYNVALIAPAMGLGTCFVSMAQKAIGASRQVKRATGLPPEHRVLAVLAVGYPEARRLKAVFRSPLDAVSAEVSI